jgi:hypothetical protein
MEDAGDKAEMLGRITAEQSQTGKAEEAYELAKSQKAPLSRAKAFLGLARGLLTADDKIANSGFVVGKKEEEEEPESDDEGPKFASKEGDLPERNASIEGDSPG